MNEPRVRIVKTTSNKYSGNGKEIENEKCKSCNFFAGINSMFCKRGFAWKRVITNPCHRPMKFIGTVVDSAAGPVCGYDPAFIPATLEVK